MKYKNNIIERIESLKVRMNLLKRNLSTNQLTKENALKEIDSINSKIESILSLVELEH